MVKDYWDHNQYSKYKTFIQNYVNNIKNNNNSINIITRNIFNKQYFNNDIQIDEENLLNVSDQVDIYNNSLKNIFNSISNFNKDNNDKLNDKMIS